MCRKKLNENLVNTFMKQSLNLTTNRCVDGKISWQTETRRSMEIMICVHVDVEWDIRFVKLNRRFSSSRQPLHARKKCLSHARYTLCLAWWMKIEAPKFVPWKERELVVCASSALWREKSAMRNISPPHVVRTHIDNTHSWFSARSSWNWKVAGNGLLWRYGRLTLRTEYLSCW